MSILQYLPIVLNVGAFALSVSESHREITISFAARLYSALHSPVPGWRYDPIFNTAFEWISYFF